MSSIDLTNELTVFVITTDRSVNYNDCIEALKSQNSIFNIVVIRNFYPMSRAFQKMIDNCKTPYYIQVDDDMIMYPNSIETMYNAIINSDKKEAMICFKLKDIHLDFIIDGVKIYKHKIFKNFPYNLSCLSCEVEQTNRMKSRGYKFITKEIVLGDHSPKWTDDNIFERYYNLMEKYKKYEYSWLANIPNKLLRILQKNPSKKNLYALLGAYTSIIKKDIDNEEKSYVDGKKDEFIKIKTFMNERPKKLNIVKIIDQWGWAYYYIGIEQQRYTKHNIILQKYNEVTVNLDNIDVMYFHGPDMHPKTTDVLIQNCRDRGIPIVGGYGGMVNSTYPYADVIATISPETYDFAKKNYKKPIVFLPESIDTNYFSSDVIFDKKRFNVGYAGSTVPLKRIHLFSRLDFPVIKKCDWGSKFWTKKTQDHMKEFYKSIDVLILLSNTECMPRVILEAMSMGLPVIATNVGCISMLLGKEWIVDVNPEEKVVKQVNERLNYLFKNHRKRKEVGIRNRNYVEENFSWKKTQPIWDDFFEKVYKCKKDELVNFLNYMNNFLKDE